MEAGIVTAEVAVIDVALVEGGGEQPTTEWAVGHQPGPVTSGGGHDVGFGLAPQQRPLELHRGHRVHRRGLLELVDGHLGQPEVTDLAGLDQIGHGAHGVSDRDLRVDAVQVVQIDRLDAKPLQRRLAIAAHVLRPSVKVHTVLVADDAELGRHRHVLAAPGQNATDQCLVVALPVADRGVQHGHAQLECVPDEPDRFSVVDASVALGQAHTPQSDGRGRERDRRRTEGGRLLGADAELSLFHGFQRRPAGLICPRPACADT